MKKQFRLKKRNRFFFCMLPHETTFHTTHATTKAGAEKYVLDLIKSGGLNLQITLNEFAKDFFTIGKSDWIRRNNQKGRLISEEMAEMRTGHLKNYILPRFGKLPIASISAIQIDDWLFDLELKNNTKNHILGTFRILFSEACYRNILKENPISHIKRFAKNQRDRDIFTKQELEALFQICDELIEQIWVNRKYYSLFFLMATTGIRLGEALALRWNDFYIKEDGWFLPITKAVKNTGKIGSTKNGKERPAIILNSVRLSLIEWRKLTEYSHDNDLVFPNNEGEILQGSRCLDTFKKALKKAGVVTENRNLVIHSLRHTFNTNNRRPLGDTILREITGHSSVEMTNHYDHQTMEERIIQIAPCRKVMEESWNSCQTG